MENYEKKFDEAFADKAFVDKVFAMTEPEDVQKAFAEKGIELTLEDVKEIGRRLSESADGELNESALEDVAGGVITGVTVAAVITCVVAVGKLGFAVSKAISAKW